MPEYSGVAATFGPPQPVEQPAGNQVMDFMERLVNIRNAQKQQAAGQLQGALKMSTEFGFFVDPKKIAKLVKAADLPISMKTEDMAAGVLAGKKSQADKGPVGAGGAGTAGIAATGAAMGKQMGAEKDQANQANQAKMKPEEQAGAWINQLATRARTLMNQKSQNEEVKASNDLLVNKLKEKVLAGGEGADEAIGKLVGLNEWKFDVQAQQWLKASPEQRGKMIDMAAGMESDAQKAERGTKIGESMLTSGRFPDPSDAFTAGKQLVESGAMSPELKAKMRPYSIQEMSDQARLGESLTNMGVPPNKLGKVMRAAEAGGLINSLPSNLKPVAIEGLKLEQERVGLEAGRVQAEQTRAIAEMIKAETGAKTKDQKESLDNFKSLVEIKKAGGSVPDALLKAAQADLGNKFGMDVSLTKTWWDYVTFSDPSGISMSPHLSDEGKSTVHKFAGRDKPKSSNPSVLQNLYKAATSPQKDPI